jgi:hypothetical protein
MKQKLVILSICYFLVSITFDDAKIISESIVFAEGNSIDLHSNTKVV